ncbi:MAG TPA: TonB-dependent receptor [Verrucomicrobiae bacterium]|nr:TonB-dependent receptor [Verrucomicrobiae bacterium]
MSTCATRDNPPALPGAAAWLLMLVAGVAAASSPTALSADLTQLPLEDLLKIEVTSVSRHSEPLLDAAAAVFVVTAEDIRRSGARSIAEALRGVPGIFVARIGDLNTHEVSSRGFADRLSNKLEVLIDGRTAYTPLISGVAWDTLDTFLPDIDRIEVIRGPGATLWGPNAVNGVINIVTKRASDTRGSLLQAGAGTEERMFAGVRSGGRIGDLGDLRAYAKRYERDGLKDVAGNDTFNVARFSQVGLRADLAPAKSHALTLSGDAYDGEREDQFMVPPGAGDVQISGGNVGFRWDWQVAEGSAVSMQAYYDQTRRFIPNVAFRERRDNGDFHIQHHLALAPSHTVVYGGAYRYSHDVTGEPPLFFVFSPSVETLEYYSAFLQDQWALGGGMKLTLGSKFEHNDYTGWEIQPNLRLGARLTDAVFAWGAVSRAARTPSRLDRALAAPIGERGNPDQDTEKLVAYEIGTRILCECATIDLALFWNAYDDLRSRETGAPPRFGNGIKGRGTGGEVAVAWQPADAVTVRWSYAYLDLEAESKPGSTDTTEAAVIEDSSPRHQAGIRTYWQPSPAWNAAAFLRYVSEVGAEAREIPAYAELNARLGWRLTEQVEIALVGENLFDAQHAEARTPTSYSEVERSGLVEVNWSWD